MATKKRKVDSTAENGKAMTIVAILVLVALFAGVFTLTYTIVRKKNTPKDDISLPDFKNVGSSVDSSDANIPALNTPEQNSQNLYYPVNPDSTTAENGQNAETTSASAQVNAQNVPSNGTIPYPQDTASWQLICVNKNRCVDSSYESSLSLSYVAGSGEQMDSRAASAYEKMYNAASADGIYLTPCSGYRSYSTQKRLYYEFYNEYIAQGYSEEEAHNLTSRRRNPPGSSEHNLGICMDIICADSAVHFENTQAYAWLQSNAYKYGFILRYPEDKESVTGVKFEPWHWRYVGVENAERIKNSGLCLEEYLGV